jgi:cyclopropane fatty-acyl-phospholipid synthase-like methyltransferase
MDHAREAAAIFNRLAQEYQDTFMDVSRYAQALELFCAGLPGVAPQVLELGCGPGNISAWVLQQKPGAQLYGTDLSENMVVLAQQNNPAARFAVMDCRDMDQLKEAHDGIIASFVLPYLNYEETRRLVSDCARLLQAAGMLYLSAIEGNYNTSAPLQGSKGDWILMHYYLQEDLLHFLDENGLDLLEVFKFHTVMGKGKEIVELVLVAKKK